jgi:hypothetical protein
MLLYKDKFQNSFQNSYELRKSEVHDTWSHIIYTYLYYRERNQLKIFLTQIGPALPSCRTH